VPERRHYLKPVIGRQRLVRRHAVDDGEMTAAIKNLLQAVVVAAGGHRRQVKIFLGQQDDLRERAQANANIVWHRARRIAPDHITVVRWGLLSLGEGRQHPYQQTDRYSAFPDHDLSGICHSCFDGMTPRSSSTGSPAKVSWSAASRQVCPRHSCVSGHSVKGPINPDAAAINRFVMRTGF